ncbi:MAG: hypothetical protein ACOVP1_09725 [Bacteroidia bacterium]
MINFLQEIYSRNQNLFWFGSFNFFVSAVLLIILPFVQIQVMGVHALIKPIKFAMSIAIYSWTMAWYMFYIKDTNLAWMNGAIILLLGFEILYIGFQAAKGQLSHFNLSSPLYSVLYSLMALAASGVTVLTAYLGILLMKQSPSHLPEYYQTALQCGIWIFVIFSFQGFAMGSRLTHTIGAIDGGKGIPFLNWSISAGDLRIAHFIGMHALQLIPILAYYLFKNSTLTIVVSLAYAILAAITWYMALHAKSPFYFLK